jgi:2-polyprenyl-3-methyl-5-hydroxy-6-metoxy-1,4-benzoquinol methylase
LSKHFEENSFDISWIHNALDHSQQPVEVIREMIKITKYGGYIFIVTGEIEGSFESFFGLHQHNLFFKENGLYLQTLKSKETGELTPEVNTIKDLPVKIHSSKVTDVNGRKWIELILKKQCPFFHGDRTEENKNFFDALVNSWLPVYSNPNFSLWGKFALTTNSRGNYVLNILQKYTEIKGKDYLDIGTSYGGFPIIFHSAGAKSVIGLDISNEFLKLARANARDNGVSEDVFRKIDITKPGEVAGLLKHFDIVTLNDVIEHVDDISQTIENIRDLLKPEGIAYLEIPNKYYTEFVLRDGHYGLFGITLLNKREAEGYYNEVFPGSKYTVGEYLSLYKYQQIFKKFNLSCEIIEETFDTEKIEKGKKALITLKKEKESILLKVPKSLQSTIKGKLNRYLKGFESCKEEELEQKYLVPFWKILLRKKSQ